MKKGERRRIDAFELWCWRRLLRVPWTAKRSNQSILKEISPGISLEGMMLKLKLQCNVGDLGLIPGSGRFPGEGNGDPVQYSCLGNPMDRGAWWATVHRVAKSWTQLSN